MHTTSERLPARGILFDRHPLGSGSEVAVFGDKPYIIGDNGKLWEGFPDGWRGPAQARARITQQGKKFLPRVLAVRAGSVVEFPNMDPFFHNVFSLFDGKRFDLGLYEAGSSRSVTFSRSGVSYIFCNIHPDMNAVVVTVDSDHFATSVANGTFTIADVPPGRYQLNVWHDRFKPGQPTEYPRPVTVPAGGLALGPIALVDTGQNLTHQNKFGHDYVPPNASAPIYR